MRLVLEPTSRETREIVGEIIRGKNGHPGYIEPSGGSAPFVIKTTALMESGNDGHIVGDHFIALIASIDRQLRRQRDPNQPSREVDALTGIGKNNKMAVALASRLNIYPIHIHGDMHEPTLRKVPRTRQGKLVRDVVSVEGVRRDDRATLATAQLLDRFGMGLGGAVYLVDLLYPDETRECIPGEPPTASLTDFDTVFRGHPLEDTAHRWREKVMYRRT